MQKVPTESEIVALYHQSHLGGFSVSSSVPRVWPSHPWKDMVAKIARALHCFNPSNILAIDFVLRSASSTNVTVCAPHVPARLTNEAQPEDAAAVPLLRQLVDDPTAKWSLLDKCRFKQHLGVLIAYTAIQCHKMFGGGNNTSHVFTAAIPLSVDNDTHKNMLLLRRVRGGEPARVFLFEPNGRRAANDAKPGLGYSNMELVRQAVHRAQILLEQSDAGIAVLDPQLASTSTVGLQTVLGSHTKHTMEGYPICAAVSYWILKHWMERGEDESFADINERLMRKLHWSQPQWQAAHRSWNAELQDLSNKFTHDQRRLQQNLRTVEQGYQKQVNAVKRAYRSKKMSYPEYTRQHDNFSRNYKQPAQQPSAVHHTSSPELHVQLHAERAPNQKRRNKHTHEP